MRCKACDVILDDVELTRKDSDGNFYDLCALCYTATVAAGWELDNTVNIPQEDYLELQETYDTIYHSITKETD